MSVSTTQLRSPGSEDTGPPKKCFLDAEWFRRDLEAIFRPKWLLAGHINELDEPGRYLTYSLDSSEVIICRDSDNRLRGFHNVCSHRGARLCRGDGPLGKRIVCPYHGWTYSLSDGALVSTPHMPADFDRRPWGLHPVHIDTWFGLIFVCLADRPPPPMAEYARGVHFGGYRFDQAKLATAKTHQVMANWKIVVENNLECYHCPQNHPELIAVRDWKNNATIEAFSQALASRAAGLEVIQTEIPCTHTVNNEKVCSIPFPRSSADPGLAFGLIWEPGMAMILSRDHGWIFSPKPIGPNCTELKQYWFVAADAVEGRDYDVERLRQFWDITMQQDRVICENVQRGMEMPAYVPGPLNRLHQTGQAGFFAWYREQIHRHFPQPRPTLSRGAVGT